MNQVTLAKNQMRAENWRSLISACRQSGQTVVNRCQENGIHTKTYYYWLRKLRKQELSGKELPIPVSENKPVVFRHLEVKTPLERNRTAVIIHLPSAAIEVADGTSQSTVEAVLPALQCLC